MNGLRLSGWIHLSGHLCDGAGTRVVRKWRPAVGINVANHRIDNMFYWLDSTMYNCTQYHGNTTLHIEVFFTKSTLQYWSQQGIKPQRSSVIWVVVSNYLPLKYQ